MKIKIKVSDIKPVLKVLSKLSNSKSTYLWDQSLLIRATDDNEYIRLFAASMPIVALVSCKALAIEERGMAIVDYKRFVQGVTPLASGDEVEITNTDNYLTASFSNGSFTIPIVPCDTPKISPDLTNPDEKTVLKFKWGTIGELLAKASVFAAKNSIRPALNGVFLSSKPEVISIASTDAHSMCWMGVKGENGNENNKNEICTILPAKICEVVAAVETLNYGNEPLTVTFSKDRVMFENSRVTVASPCVDAKYPDYKSVIPTNGFVRIVVDRGAMLSAVKRIEGFADEHSGAIKMHSEGGELLLSAYDDSYGIKASANVQEELYEEQFADIALNAPRLRAMLEAITTEKINILSSGSDRGVIFHPEDDNKDVVFNGMIMPMMIP